MSKPVPDPIPVATAPLHRVISERWSPRAFAPRPVETEKLRSLFEAARWAPSCYNEQPWRFIVATREDAAFDRLASCLVEANHWAVNAPVLLVTIARTHFAKNGKPNRHAWHDVGLAMGGLLAQATALGLHVHQMAGFEPDRARSEFAIPEGFDPVAMAALGYVGDAATLPERLRAQELAARERRDLRETVFAGRFGDVSPLAG